MSSGAGNAWPTSPTSRAGCGPGVSAPRARRWGRSPCLLCPTEHRGQRPPPAALDVEIRRIVDEAAASAAGVVLANCGVIDAMVAMLVDVESLEGEGLDRFRAAVAQPEPPMALVAS